MGKPLELISAKPLKVIGRKLTQPTRKPLDFVPDEPNPLVGLPDAKNLEDKCAQELDAIGKAFRQAAKDESAAAAHELEGYGSEYFVCVFADAAQATAFLKAIKYPDPYDVFVDGTIIAELVGAELPAARATIKKLKPKQDKKLLALISNRKE